MRMRLPKPTGTHARRPARPRLSSAAVVLFVPVGLGFGALHVLSTSPGTDATHVAEHAAEPVLGEGLAARSVAATTRIGGVLELRTKAERNRLISLSSPKGRHTFTASSLASHDLPSAAMRAYRNAAGTIDGERPGCHLPWTLLAGIGRVESDHGRYGGSVLGRDGVSRPAVVGVALNGQGTVAAIRDTDGGALDGDTVWDRAVGPMQFIPSTWRSAGRDGDGNGTKSPDDIDDAALAAAGYLCDGGGDLSSPAAARAAIFRYNPSGYYVDLVSAYARGYRDGSFVIPSPDVSADAADGMVHLSAEHTGAHATTSRSRSGKTTKTTRTTKGTKGTGTRASSAHHASPHPTSPHPTSPHPTSPHASTPTPPTPTPAPTPAPTPTPTPVLLSVQGPVTAVPGGWQVATVPVTAADLALVTVQDWDGDGVVETVAQELTGLVAEPSTIATMTYHATPAFSVQTFAVVA